jgi:hypothetical protein
LASWWDGTRAVPYGVAVICRDAQWRVRKCHAYVNRYRVFNSMVRWLGGDPDTDGDAVGKRKGASAVTETRPAPAD